MSRRNPTTDGGGLVPDGLLDEVQFRVALWTIVRDRAEPWSAAGERVLSVVRRYISRPARLVRPRVVLASAAAHGVSSGCSSANGPDGATAGPVYRLAQATELLHVFALIHDDAIDGEPESSADGLLAGDLLHAAGFGLLADTVATHHLPGAILRVVERIAVTTIMGQAEDIAYRRGEDPPSFERLFRMYDLKTGWYTYVAPLQIGALASTYHDPDLDRLQAVGTPLGRAYQLVDDFFDTCAAIDVLRSGASETVPPWEFNLLVTWYAEERLPYAGWSRTRDGFAASNKTAPARDDAPVDNNTWADGTGLPASEWVGDFDLDAFAAAVTRRRSRLLDEAYRAVQRLELPEERRNRLWTVLRDTVPPVRLGSRPKPSPFRPTKIDGRSTEECR